MGAVGAFIGGVGQGMQEGQERKVRQDYVAAQKKLLDAQLNEFETKKAFSDQHPELALAIHAPEAYKAQREQDQMAKLEALLGGGPVPPEAAPSTPGFGQMAAELLVGGNRFATPSGIATMAGIDQTLGSGGTVASDMTPAERLVTLRNSNPILFGKFSKEYGIDKALPKFSPRTVADPSDPRKSVTVWTEEGTNPGPMAEPIKPVDTQFTDEQGSGVFQRNPETGLEIPGTRVYTGPVEASRQPYSGPDGVGYIPVNKAGVPTGAKVLTGPAEGDWQTVETGDGTKVMKWVPKFPGGTASAPAPAKSGGKPAPASKAPATGGIVVAPGELDKVLGDKAGTWYLNGKNPSPTMSAREAYGAGFRQESGATQNFAFGVLTDGLSAIKDIRSQVLNKDGSVNRKLLLSSAMWGGNDYTVKNTNKYKSAVVRAGIAAVRPESGAAISSTEDQKVLEGYIPKVTDSPETVRYKLDALEAKIKEQARGRNINLDGAESKKAWDAFKAKKGVK